MDLSGRLSNHDLATFDPYSSPSGQSTQLSQGREPYQRQKHVRLSGNQAEELLSLYTAGSSVSELARRYAIHRTTVLLHLERHGVDRRPATRRLTGGDLKQAAAFYAAGESLATVAGRFGVNASTVARAFRSAGLPTRLRRGA